MSLWNDVLLGIEEEGIPFVVQESHSADIIHSAWLAACQSPLLVGIGCNREQLVVHYKIYRPQRHFYADVSTR